jgi:hypothetical protein
MNAVFKRSVLSSCRIINSSKHFPCNISARVGHLKCFSTVIVKKEKIDPIAKVAQDRVARLRIAEEAKKSAGGYCANLIYKGKLGNPLAIGDLKNLLLLCKEKGDLKTVKRAVQMYQRRGQDFSEETGASFVNTCLRLNEPKLAGEVLSKYKNRIGSWVTKKPLLNLFEALAELKEVEMMVTISEVLHLKGNPSIQAVDTLELVVKSASSNGDIPLYSRSVEIATKILYSSGAAELVRIKESYPSPVIAVEGEGEGESETKTEEAK